MDNENLEKINQAASMAMAQATSDLTEKMILFFLIAVGFILLKALIFGRRKRNKRKRN